MRRLAYTGVLTVTLLCSGCYQRTIAPETPTDEADVQAFRDELGIEPPVESNSPDEQPTEKSADIENESGTTTGDGTSS